MIGETWPQIIRVPRLTRNVLVTSASGAVGPSVAQALCEAGHSVRTFSLDRPLAGAFPQNVDGLIGDVTDKSAVQSAMHGVEAVIHLAALLHIVNPPPELREKYEKINVGGTATVLDAAVLLMVSAIMIKQSLIHR